MINKQYTYALVGASWNIEKYGYKVFKNLLEKGYTIYPINPKWWKLLWQEVFTSLINSKIKCWNIDVVIFVTPPNVSFKVLEEVKKLTIKKVWFQPWANDEACIDFCNAHGIEEVHNACMMVRG